LIIFFREESIRVVTKYSLSWKKVLLMIVVVVTQMVKVGQMVKVVQTVKVEKETVMLSNTSLKLVEEKYLFQILNNNKKQQDFRA